MKRSICATTTRHETSQRNVDGPSKHKTLLLVVGYQGIVRVQVPCPISSTRHFVGCFMHAYVEYTASCSHGVTVTSDL